MLKTLLLIASLFTLFSFKHTQAQTGSNCDYMNYNDGHFASVNGVRLYYKQFGEGKQTILLLHSAYRSMESYCEQINVLSTDYRVIAMDTRGHGRSTDNDQPYTYALFASDVDALLTQLGVQSATLVGIGDGANTALQVAMTYPKKVEKLVVAGANLTADSKAVSENILRSVRTASAQSLDSAVIRFYTRFNDNPKNFPIFFEKMRKLLLNYPILTGEELKTIQAPTLVLSGDHDFILLNNTVKIFKSIPKSYLCVVPGAEHYIFQQNSGFVNWVLLDFLKKEYVPLKKY